MRNPLTKRSAPKRTRSSSEQEPIGIVISRGRITEATPLFSAYVWGVSEEPEETPEDSDD
jgi:hypothetical protein